MWREKNVCREKKKKKKKYIYIYIYIYIKINDYINLNMRLVKFESIIFKKINLKFNKSRDLDSSDLYENNNGCFPSHRAELAA